MASKASGSRHHLRTDSSLTLSEDLPAVAVAVDTRQRIDALVGDAAAVCEGALLTLERARLFSGNDHAIAVPPALGAETKLTVYLGRHERAAGSPAYAAVCDLLRRREIAGASTLLGVDGTARGARERARFFGGNATVPTMVIAVGASGRIALALPELSACCAIRWSRSNASRSASATDSCSAPRTRCRGPTSTA